MCVCVCVWGVAHNSAVAFTACLCRISPSTRSESVGLLRFLMSMSLAFRVPRNVVELFKAPTLSHSPACPWSGRPLVCSEFKQKSPVNGFFFFPEAADRSPVTVLWGSGLSGVTTPMLPTPVAVSLLVLTAAEDARLLVFRASVELGRKGWE